MGERCPIRGTSLYLVLKSNGPHRSKNFPVKFDFSPKTVPANIVQKLSAHSLLKSVFFRISTSLTNAPRSLSQAKVGTHLTLLKGSHTRAHTPKQGPSLPWPQCGFVLPAKSLLFRHDIHFPVLCEPSLSATALSQTIFHRVFNFLYKRSMFAFAGESGYTLGFAQRIAHGGSHAETGGVSDGGAITTLGAFRTFTNIPGPGIRTAYFAAFGSWPGGALEERRKPSGQRCVYACRCPEGVAAPLGCVALLPLFVQYDLAGRKDLTRRSGRVTITRNDRTASRLALVWEPRWAVK